MTLTVAMIDVLIYLNKMTLNEYKPINKKKLIRPIF